MIIKRKSESGQAIVFLTLGFVIFLGFVALAIDGGMAYSDRRDAQNLSDTSALAAAGLASLELENRDVFYSTWNCSSTNIQAAIQVGQTTAINRAAANGFVIDEDISDHNGVTAVCGQDNSHGYIERYIDFTVQISTTTETSFAQLFIPNGIQVNTEATTRIRPRTSLAFGNSIVALNPAGCQGQQNGALFHGNAETYVTGGGIWSNGCLRTDGGPYVEVTGGTISYVVELSGGGGLHPAPVQADEPIPPSSYHLPAPDCSDSDAHNVTGAWLLSHSPLDPGLYCVTGQLKFNGGDELVGDGVTLYLRDNGIRINGNANIQLSAPSIEPDPSPAIAGVVIYLDPNNHNELQINGTADSYWVGTILAPGADIDMLGNGFISTYHAQIIGWNVQVGGTADLFNTFDETLVHTRPTNLEMYR